MMKSLRLPGGARIERIGVLTRKGLARLRSRRACDADHDERPGVCESLFPWPVRLLIIAAAYVLLRVLAHTNAAMQLGWSLAYAGVVAISLAVSFWLAILVADGGSAAVWLMLTRWWPSEARTSPTLYWTHQIIELVNRQCSHILTFWIWMGVLLPLEPRVDFQIPALLALAMFGPALIDWLTGLRHPLASRGSGALQSARRPVIYSFTVLGLVILIAQSADQRSSFLRLVLAIGIGLALRLWRHRIRARHAQAYPDKVQAFRRRQRQLTRGMDVVMGPIFMFAGLAGVLLLSLWVRHHQGRLTREKLDGPPPDAQRCVPESNPPVEASISMFLVADSQVRELGGERFPGQTELADLLVPSAVRPVELDMLGMASVARLRRMFEEVVDGAGKRPVFWAHLGDLADLSCAGEIERGVKMFSGFGPGRLAGIAIGNHDMSFTGNFLWSPHWSGACKSSRADKPASNHLIVDLLQRPDGVLARSARMSWPKPSWLRDWLLGTSGVVTATPLGTIQHRDAARTVVALFIDTGDDAAFDWGIAGRFGTYSSDQDDRIRQLVRNLKGDGVKDPVWLVFMHHPVGDMTSGSRDRLNRTLAWLDGDPLDERPERSLLQPEPRVIATIAAHTHRAETHRRCAAGRVVRELVIGSTIDPPQQAAVLEIGTDPRGLAAVRLTTIPTIARPDFTCDARPPMDARPAMIDAEDCQRIVSRLRGEASCAPLFDEGPGAPRDCGELERHSDLGDRLGALFSSSSPVEPDAIRRMQGARARRLMDCVCRHDGCPRLAPDADPLDDDLLMSRLETRLERGKEEAEKELACLSWAASAQQAHKAAGMTFASALRCAFDDRTLPAAQQPVATLDFVPCQ